MPSPVLGVDLGTTNSVVAYADEQRVRVLRDTDGNLITPSTVSFPESGEVLVGKAARDRRLFDVANTVFSIKRLIGRPFRSEEVRRGVGRLPFRLEEGSSGGAVVRARSEVYSLPEISSFILRHLRRVAEQSLGQSCVNAVITVPANFNELQRMATRDAGRIAGLNVLRILNEPTAAALAYGYRANQQRRIAVYDFGGGTFDISILELSGDVIEVVATAGDTQLGGDDLDRALADRMATAFETEHGVDVRGDREPFERVALAAEWIKCQLSEIDAAQATIKELAVVRGKPRDLCFRMSRRELHELLLPLIGRTFTICEDALRLAGVRPSQLDAVLLVGGQTRTPKVRQMVAEYFGIEPQSSIDPDLAVAQGAALQGYALAGMAAAQGLGARGGRTLSGPASAPQPWDDPFEDEPTRVATSKEALHATSSARRPDTPFEDLPTTITMRDPDFEPTKVGEVRVGQPSVRPGGAIGTHPSTLAGVGPKREVAAAPGAAAGPSQPEQVSSAPAVAERDVDARETLAERPGAKVGVGPSNAAPAPSAARAAWSMPAPPVRPAMPAPSEVPRPSEAPGLGAARDDEQDDQELPAALRASDASEPDAATTLLERASAKARSARPPDAAAPDAAFERDPQRSGEPIRTLSMARLLTSQGHLARALAIYGDLIEENPADPALAGEAAALRARLSSAGMPAVAEPKRPQTGSRRAPPPPPPAARSLPPHAAAPVSAAPVSAASASAAPVSAAPVSAALVSAAPVSAALVSAAPASAASASAAPVSAASASAAPKATPDRAQAAVVAFVSPTRAAVNELSMLAGTAAENAQSQFPAPPSIAPLLLDVTPHTLCVETVGGFCESVIERNAPIPTEQTRVFSTSQDYQNTVSARVCQGESRRTEENQVLGQLDLLGLRPARRGEVSIAVTFIIDADGTLKVRAVDEGTGRGQEIRVSLVGAIGEQELEQMRSRQRRAAYSSGV